MSLQTQSASLSRDREPCASRLKPGLWLAPVSLILTAVWFASVRPACGQEEHKRKVPVLDKVTNGSEHQAFSGTVQSLDLRREVLSVNTVQGGGTEIFPVKKSVHVETANGDKLKLRSLLPGTNVIIYYEQRGDRRTVRDIVVLERAPTKEGEKKPLPPS
jgi:hypothetical protein